MRKKDIARKIMSSVLCAAMAVTLVACGDASSTGAGSTGQSSGSSQNTDDKATQQMLDMVEHMDEPTKEAMKNIPESGSASSAGNADVVDEASNEDPKPTASAKDPLEALVTDPEVCREYTGYYVIKDGKYYATGGHIPYAQVKGSGIGSLENASSGEAALYKGWENGAVVSMGDVPILTVEDSDTLIGYGGTTGGLIPYNETPMPSMRLKVDSYNSWTIYSADEEPVSYSMDHMQQVQLEDADGNIREAFKKSASGSGIWEKVHILIFPCY